MIKTFNIIPVDPFLKKVILESGDKQARQTAVKGAMTAWRMQKYFAHLVQTIESLVDGRISDIWGAVYKKDDYAEAHDHRECKKAFVYFVDVCQDCAPLVVDGNEIIPLNGKLVVFSGLVEHSVPPQTCDHDRIVIAGNINDVVS
jgi:hypothetical protein